MGEPLAKVSTTFAQFLLCFCIFSTSSYARPYLCNWTFAVKASPNGVVERVTSGRHSDVIFDWDDETIRVKYLKSNTVVVESIEVEIHDQLWSDGNFSFSKDNLVLLVSEINHLHDNYPTKLHYYLCK